MLATQSCSHNISILYELDTNLKKSLNLPHRMAIFKMNKQTHSSRRQLNVQPFHMIFYHKKAYFILIIIIYIACARQGMPPGGPVDKKPPFIVSTIPKSDTTNVPLDTKIEIKFNEAVDPTSCEESIFITPFPGDDVKYKWRGSRLRIVLPQKLLPNRTYVIAIGAGTKDRRNNTMKDSFVLAFSTGPVLDKASVTGQVFADATTKGIHIWAYDLKDDAQPDPAKQFPLYITQTGETGNFRLANLAFGSYRIFAVADRELNNRYDAEYDLLGVAARDVQLSAETPDAYGLFIRTSVHDTTQPRLRAAVALDRNHLDLRFSEPMAANPPLTLDDIIITGSQDTLQIRDAYLDERSAAYLHIITEAQKADERYTVKIDNAMDLAGFSIPPDSNITAFTGSAKADSTKPQFLAVVPQDSAKFVPLNSKIEMLFSEKMDSRSVEKSLFVADTTGDTIAGRWSWKNGAHVIFTPKALKAMTLYQVSLTCDSTLDAFANRLADTLVVKRFTTVNPDTLSEISGALTDSDTTDSGKFFLQAQSKSGYVYDQWLENKGEYRFQNIMAGIYTLSAFRDRDGNGKFSYGEAWPFQPAERFYVFPDSIQVRSKWPNEGNNLVFPK
jgi:hypothetical protein